MIFFSFYETLKKICRPYYDGIGGTSYDRLLLLVQKAKQYILFIAIVGDNDALYKSMRYNGSRFKQIRDAKWPIEVRFAGQINEKDLRRLLHASYYI